MLTGFSLGIFALGGVIALDVSSLSTAALVINVMMITSVALALQPDWRAVDCRLLLVTLIGIVPGTLIGLWLLQNLSGNNIVILQMLLGILIISAGATMCVRPKLRTFISPLHEFGLMGFLGGLFGGLYSIAGPPIVYIFYRQPLAVRRLRATLLAIFGVMSAFRLAVLGAQGEISQDVLNLSIFSVPVVIAVSAFFTRFRPKVSDVLLRRSAFILLTCMGMFILVTAFLRSR